MNFEQIIKYWPLIIALVGIGATWVRMQNTDSNHELRITANEAEIKSVKEKFDPVLIEIRERLASIEATLKFLTKEQ